MNICLEERTAVKLNEAVMPRGKELSKNQKPRLTALLYFTKGRNSSVWLFANHIEARVRHECCGYSNAFRCLVVFE